MAEENLKDFTVNWIITGLLIFSMISFTFVFMNNNNPLGLSNDSINILTSTQSGVSSKLASTNDNADTVLNITANTNPEAGLLGSRDSVASAYSATGSGKGFFESIKILISWVFVGEIGIKLLAIFGGIVGFASFFFIVQWIRRGF
jgi:hypothetical protein